MSIELIEPPSAATNKQLFSRSFRLWNTVRYLRFGQIAWRVWYQVHKPAILKDPLECHVTPTDEPWVQGVIKASAFVSDNQVRYLNTEKNISQSSIWNDPNYEKLWLYNLHYFDDLTAEASQKRQDWHKQLIERWIDENPQNQQGNGWEPYPTSLRIVNWIKWILTGNKAPPSMLYSLAEQAASLNQRLEYHILGNHLLVNAKALCFVGLFFSGPQAKNWFNTGSRILASQLKEQVLNDGGHFELSPMYHLLVLEDLLDVWQLLTVYRAQVDEMSGSGSNVMLLKQSLVECIQGMLSWSQVMSHPDGQIPLFNDAAFGIAGFPDEVQQYATQLGFNGFGSNEAASEPTSLNHLVDSGYLKMQAGPATLFADVAAVGPDYLPGHAHADTLSFEFSLGDQRVIVNGGTSQYGANAQRQYQRSTRAHSTVVIDNRNSSDVWGGFRVGRRAKVRGVVVKQSNAEILAKAEHDGYLFLTGSPVHQRLWRLLPDEQRLIIEDQVLGKGAHDVEVILPLGPNLKPIKGDSESISIFDETEGRIICNVHTSESDEVRFEEIQWNPRFGVQIPSWRIRVILRGTLPISHTTVIAWCV